MGSTQITAVDQEGRNYLATVVCIFLEHNMHLSDVY